MPEVVPTSMPAVLPPPLLMTALTWQYMPLTIFSERTAASSKKTSVASPPDAPRSPCPSRVGWWVNPLPDGTPRLFIEEGAKLECVIINVNNGPVYIGRDAEVMEGVCIRAPFAACTHATVNMNAKIYGATTLGPYCKVGGELSNVVMQSYSNKGHDGYLGNAVIGEWCNLGADTNCSNLKNNYAEIKLWDYATHRFKPTGMQFCGLLMGDHSRSGINTMFNTATVVGVGANVYGPGFPRTVIDSFVQGGAEGFKSVPVTKVMEMAERMMAAVASRSPMPSVRCCNHWPTIPIPHEKKRKRVPSKWCSFLSRFI